MTKTLAHWPPPSTGIKPPTPPKVGDKVALYDWESGNWDDGVIQEIEANRIAGVGTFTGSTRTFGFSLSFASYRELWRYR